jgi:hypothetical protein
MVWGEVGWCGVGMDCYWGVCLILRFNNNNNNNINSVERSRGGKVTILWNQQVQTDRTIPNNQPDIVICGNKKRTCMLINVAIPGGRNVIQKEAEKILKYKDLAIEIQRLWNVKTRVIPVIIAATGTISKSFRKYVSTIPGNHEVSYLQKTAILGTAHKLCRVMM